MVPKKIRDFSEYREVTGTPRESYWAYWAIVEERRQATGGGAPPAPCPNPNWTRGGGAAPSFLLPLSPFPLSLSVGRKEGGPILLGLGVQVGPPWRALLGRQPPPPPFIYRGRGHPKGTSIVP